MMDSTAIFVLSWLIVVMVGLTALLFSIVLIGLIVMLISTIASSIAKDWERAKEQEG